MKSDVVKKGIERAPHRSLLYALGCNRPDMDKPFIGIINSYSEIVPGHTHLRDIAQAVKAGVREGGGVPFEVNTIAVCDGIVMNHPGMKYSLPSRELIADSAETVAEAHAFDALVFIPNCDKIVPGMLMAAARLNIPSIFISGGPMLAGRFGDDSRKVDLISAFEGVGEVLSGKMSQGELEQLEQAACPGCGSCSGMFTANTMNCLIEVLGIGLPGNGTIPAVDSRRQGLAREAGRAVMRLLKDNVRPRDLINQDSIYNALTVDMALGASTNSVLHLMAIAHEAGVAFPLSLVNEISQNTPCLCKLSPAYVDARTKYHIEDLDHAGGISAVMNEIKGLLKLNLKTANGGTLAEIIAGSKILDRKVIRPVNDPFAATGGLAILFGNLAPDGAVVRRSAVAKEMLSHRGPARVFDSEEEATRAIMGHKINGGDVIVIRYEGPKGGPGMREMLTPTSLLSGLGTDNKVALITDGRFSGGSRGAAIGHVSPEAASRGPIAALKDGDTVVIDIPDYRLAVELTDEEIKNRLAQLPAFEPKVKSGYLRYYAEKVCSASTGAVFGG